MSATLHAPADPASLAQGYDPVARAFHWLVVALVAAQIVIALVLPAALPASAENTIAAWHVSVGPTILFVMLLRLAWRLTHTPPPAPVDLTPGLRLLARATHWAFYVLLIVMPLLGWVAVNAYGGTPRLFGFIPLPALVSSNKPLAETVGAVHGTLALVLAGLIVLHVSGALYHALVKRDGVMGRMLPGRASRGG